MIVAAMITIYRDRLHNDHDRTGWAGTA